MNIAEKLRSQGKLLTAVGDMLSSDHLTDRDLEMVRDFVTLLEHDVSCNDAVDAMTLALARRQWPESRDTQRVCEFVLNIVANSSSSDLIHSLRDPVGNHPDDDSSSTAVSTQ